MPGGAEEGRAREPELAREEQRGVWSVTRVGPPEDNQSASQSETPPSMEDVPTRTHTLHTIGSREPTRDTLSPAVAPGPDCWTRSTQLTDGQSTGPINRQRFPLS